MSKTYLVTTHFPKDEEGAYLHAAFSMLQKFERLYDFSSGTVGIIGIIKDSRRRSYPMLKLYFKSEEVANDAKTSISRDFPQADVTVELIR